MQALLLAAVLLPLASAFVLPEAPKNPENLDVYTIPYNDATARKKILFAAGAAYGSNPQQCLDKAFTGASIRRIITARCDVNPADKCVGYTAVSPQDKAIIVVFRGTNNNVQLILEGLETVFEYHVRLKFRVLRNKWSMFQTPWAAGGVVSQYFNDGFLNIWNAGLKDDFNTLAAQNPGFQVWVRIRKNW